MHRTRPARLPEGVGIREREGRGGEGATLISENTRIDTRPSRYRSTRTRHRRRERRHVNPRVGTFEDSKSRNLARHSLASFPSCSAAAVVCRLPQRESLLISSHYSAPNLQNNAGLPLPSSAVILAIQWRQQLPLPPALLPPTLPSTFLLLPRSPPWHFDGRDLSFSRDSYKTRKQLERSGKTLSLITLRVLRD